MAAFEKHPKDRRLIQERIRQQLVRCDALRRNGDWAQALLGYKELQTVLPQSATLLHNMALCSLALFDYESALELSRMALRQSSQLWQSGFVQSKALVALGRPHDALVLIETLHQQHPEIGDLRTELSKLLLQHAGAAHQAYQLVKPLLEEPAEKEAQMVGFISQLYDRQADVDAQQLSDQIVAFSKAHMSPNGKLPGTPKWADRTRAPRLRVGVMSPQWTVSPVYFFAYGGLRELARYVDLIFIDRGHKADWATHAFKAVAHQWLPAGRLQAEALTKALVEEDLDVLIDLGGWMDPVGLKAMVDKPARRIFKWVGGQSATTGMGVFDGFLTDDVQTPRGSESLYSEPLIRLRTGYVTYSPPTYLPAPQPSKGKVFSMGVIANPSKVSRAFLAELRVRIPQWKKANRLLGKELVVTFIDHRYQHTNVRQRIETALGKGVANFIAPANHLSYLRKVCDLDVVLDTWPYCGGLTTVEALCMGVPVVTHPDRLFCERHSWSHLHFGGQDPEAFAYRHFNGQWRPKNGQSLLHPQSNRFAHKELAHELLRVFNEH